MTKLTLTIGDKNLSSWSFRPWYLLMQSDIPFTEQNIKLDQPQSRGELKEKSPSGLVPFLSHGGTQVWDSLAIMEYVAELHPEKLLWPEDSRARAVARAVSAEMHSGFSAMRTVWPMMFLRDGLHHTTSGGVAKDIARIDELWTMCRTHYGSGGDFLFGKFSIADAMYAPVVSRFFTYGPVNVSKQSAAFMDAMRGTDAWEKWNKGAEAEVAE